MASAAYPQDQCYQVTSTIGQEGSLQLTHTNINMINAWKDSNTHTCTTCVHVLKVYHVYRYVFLFTMI